MAADIAAAATATAGGARGGSAAAGGAEETGNGAAAAVNGAASADSGVAAAAAAAAASASVPSCPNLVRVGDRVRVRNSVKMPKYKWGSVTHSAVGVVKAISPNGQDLTIDFPQVNSRLIHYLHSVNAECSMIHFTYILRLIDGSII